MLMKATLVTFSSSHIYTQDMKVGRDLKGVSTREGGDWRNRIELKGTKMHYIDVWDSQRIKKHKTSMW